MRRGFCKGMTIAELLVASSLSLVVLTGVLMLTTFVQSTWRNERVNSKVLINLEVAMERAQKELRYTDLNRVFYYPEGGAEYTAISFPKANDDDSDGFLEIDATAHTIIWDETVIYHLYTNAGGKKELRKTVFSPRGNLSNANLQIQLNDVVENGEPLETTPGYASWDETNGTRTLLTADDITLGIAKTAKRFDGYAAQTTRSDNTKFGGIKLASGNHYITFTPTGKNALSTPTGYRIGIDSFTTTPSGCAREAEEATVNDAHTGTSTKVNEDMSVYGSWSGNRHLEYQSDSTSDPISLNFYYDQWLETNFATASPSGTIREYSNRTGDGSGTSGNNGYSIRLPGYGESWTAATQTNASHLFSTVTGTGDKGIVIRQVIKSDMINVEGKAMKVVFDNSTGTTAMPIHCAYIMSRSGATYNSDGLHDKAITVNGSTSFTVNAGSTITSDWINVGDFDKNHDYLLTMHMWDSLYTIGSSYTIGSYSSGGGIIHSYVITDGDCSCAGDETWASPPSSEPDTIYGIGSIEASYFSGDINGDGLDRATLISQIYDTGLDNPSYGTIAWTIAKNNYGDYGTLGLGADVILRVRSNDSADALKAANDWSGALAIYTLSRTTGSENITSIGTGRNVQFQAEFLSQPTFGRSDYTKSCVLKDVTISWPGQARVVDISGYFTKRPNYGIFTVSIDGHELSKTLEIDLGITYNTSGGKTITKNMSAEIEPRNTGR